MHYMSIYEPDNNETTMQLRDNAKPIMCTMTMHSNGTPLIHSRIQTSKTYALVGT